MKTILPNVGCKPTIIDIGAGKGYLSNAIAVHFNLDVVCIESSAQNIAAAKERIEKIEDMWNSKSQRATAPNINLQKAQFTILKYLTQDITASEFEDLADNSKQREETQDIIDQENSNKTTILIGLHTCGDLAVTMMKIFQHSNDTQILLNVGCCYHDLTIMDNNDNCQTIYGFPLSSIVQQTLKDKFNNGTFRLACQPVDSWLFNLQDSKLSLKKFFYRSIMQTLLKSHFKEYPIFISHIPDNKFENFIEYSLEALKRLKGKSLQFPIDKLQETYNKYADKYLIAAAFACLRGVIAPVIESLILLDRVCYLKERGFDAHLLPLFNSKNSPRNFVLIASKIPLPIYK